jgi:hypothetical protein
MNKTWNTFKWGNYEYHQYVNDTWYGCVELNTRTGEVQYEVVSKGGSGCKENRVADNLEQAKESISDFIDKWEKASAY